MAIMLNLDKDGRPVDKLSQITLVKPYLYVCKCVDLTKIKLI